MLPSVWTKLLQRGVQSLRPRPGKHLGPNDKVLGKTQWQLFRRVNTPFVQNILSCGSKVKVVSDRDFCNLGSEGWGKKFLWNFLNSSKENISLEMAYQPFPSSLASWHCCSFCKARRSFQSIQKAVAQIFSQERNLGLRVSWHQMACSYRGLREQFHQVKLNITNI